MGADRFDNYQKGTDLQKAFDEAHEAACLEYGQGGYSGSLAEKHRFTVRNNGKPLTIKEARKFADKDLEDNEHDKWGPAWVVQVCSKNSEEVIGFLFYGSASS